MVALLCFKWESSHTILRGAVDSAVLCRSPMCFVVDAPSGATSSEDLLSLLREGFPVKMKYFSAVQRLHLFDAVL